MWALIIGLIGKILDFINPWSKFWVDKFTKADDKKEIAQKEMDKEAKGEGQKSADNYWDSFGRKHSD
jgi:hypothetical protein